MLVYVLLDHWLPCLSKSSMNWSPLMILKRSGKFGPCRDECHHRAITTPVLVGGLALPDPAHHKSFYLPTLNLPFCLQTSNLSPLTQAARLLSLQAQSCLYWLLKHRTLTPHASSMIPGSQSLTPTVSLQSSVHRSRTSWSHTPHIQSPQY